MNLILDIGNTSAKLALADSKGPTRVNEFPSPVSVSDIKEFTAGSQGIEACILSSVVRYPASVRTWLEKNFRFLELTHRTPVPLKNKYRAPEELGNDRIAGATGGMALFPGRDILVVIMGTCITYNLVNSSGEFLGGAISPGMNMRFKALHTFTDKLPLITMKGINDPLGRDTEQSILSGVINGIISETEGFSALYKRKYPQLKVILSGGDAHYFDRKLKISIFAVPNIVLSGLNQILRFNV
jgi:type III pantothenate kinase